MLELTSVRKNKVVLADYNFQQDIDHRMLLADCSAFDLEVLEEILFSPLKFSLKKLARTMGCKDEDLSSILQKLSRAGLLSLQDDSIVVDKDLRKYFEFQIVRFDPAFKPDMEFLFGLLRKVPIHHLPAWYSIPRTSNNIFESIVEKYLLTPQIYQRYLLDLNFGDPTIHGIISDLFSTPAFKLYSSDVIGKYNLTRRHFEELMLLLEFNFIGCVSYEKEDDHWIEVITPYYEWCQYLYFLKSTEAFRSLSEIERTREGDFAFIEDMSTALTLSIKKPILLSSWEPGAPLPRKITLDLATHFSLPIDSEKTIDFASCYLAQVFQKLLLIDLGTLNGQKFAPLEASRAWLEETSENKALHLYRHNKNRILNPNLSPQIATERNVRESERSLKRVLHGDWVLFDDFFKGILITLSENSVIMLKRTGKHWKYSLPVYSQVEKSLVKATIFEWLYETGMVAIGKCRGQDCFAVTPFGRFYFEE
jgi:hypothetical protein